MFLCERLDCQPSCQSGAIHMDCASQPCNFGCMCGQCGHQDDTIPANLQEMAAYLEDIANLVQNCGSAQDAAVMVRGIGRKFEE